MTRPQIELRAAAAAADHLIREYLRTQAETSGSIGAFGRLVRFGELLPYDLRREVNEVLAEGRAGREAELDDIREAIVNAVHDHHREVAGEGGEKLLSERQRDFFDLQRHIENIHELTEFERGRALGALRAAHYEPDQELPPIFVESEAWLAHFTDPARAALEQIRATAKEVWTAVRESVAARLRTALAGPDDERIREQWNQLHEELSAHNGQPAEQVPVFANEAERHEYEQFQALQSEHGPLLNRKEMKVFLEGLQQQIFTEIAETGESPSARKALFNLERGNALGLVEGDRLDTAVRTAESLARRGEELPFDMFKLVARIDEWANFEVYVETGQDPRSIEETFAAYDAIMEATPEPSAEPSAAQPDSAAREPLSAGIAPAATVGAGAGVGVA